MSACYTIKRKNKGNTEEAQVAARLPNPGSDSGAWGDILNNFLLQAHNPDGTVRPLSQSQIIDLATDLAARVKTADLWYSVRDYGAKGDGVSDDAAAIQTAVTTAATKGGTVYFPAGTYIVGATITLPGGVHLRGSGVGGDIYSSVDAQLPFRGTVIKLKSNANVDLIKTQNFASLTGSGSPSAYSTPARFGIHDVVLDGNKQQNASGLPLRIFGRTYEIQNVIIQNGASGGVYSEYGAGGYEMEARWTNFTITDCNGDGLEWRGPHDSVFTNGLVARHDGRRGIYIVGGSYVGGEMFANVHVWGSHTYQWVLGSSNAAFLNCVSDGPGGVQVLGSGNTWIGGSIYGTTATGQYAVTLGDGTSRTVSNNVFRTRVFNYSKGSIFHRLTANTTPLRNIYQIAGNLGGATRYTGGAGRSTTSGVLTFPLTTISVADISSFPTGGGNLYLSDGTTIVTCAYTGVSGSTLTGVSGGSGSLPSGAAIFSLSGVASADTWEITDPDNPVAGGFFQTTQIATLTQTWLNATSFNVGAQTLRPNSNATALQHMRNETGRVDMAWDNSGSAGAYSYQNGATVEGRSGTASGTRTWRLNAALGTVQTGSGATGSRPTASVAGTGAMWFDITLGKPIWSDGTTWRDAAGTAV